MRKTMLALLFLLATVSLAVAADEGFWQRADCATDIASPVAGKTWCRQTTTVGGFLAGDFLVYDGAWKLLGSKCVQSASDPTNTNDEEEGYSIGTCWVNTTGDTFFIATDVTAGSAVWSSGGVVDHGSLTGLGDDDHSAIYTKYESSAGVPAAGSCDRSGQIQFDTTNSDIYSCFEAAGNPINIGTQGDAFNSLSEGTNFANASGNETAHVYKAISLPTSVEVFNGTGTFTNQPTGDGVEVVSSDAGDTTQTVRIYGTTNGADQSIVLLETVTLNGTTFVATTKTDWGSIRAVTKSASTTGTVTVREASADLAITTLAPTTLRAANIDTVFVRAEYKSLTFLVGDDQGAVLADTDDKPTRWRNNIQSLTIVEVWCESNAGTPIINLQRDDGTPANILSANLSCTTSGATGTIAAAEDTLAVGDKIDFVMVTAGGTAKRVTVGIKLLVD